MNTCKVITDFLDEAAHKFPEKIGFVDEKGDTTYREFKFKAQQIASALMDIGVYKAPVAIYLSKSTNALTAAFGAMYAGNFYTFLDSEMPIARIKKITDILQPQCIITDEEHGELIDSLKLPTLKIEDAYGFGIDSNGIERCREKSIDADVAYVLFTSGSTGTPKGVVISHLNVITYMKWSKEAFRFSEKTIFGSQTPFYFSMSVLDIFQTFYCAAKLVIIPKKLFSFPIELLEFINKHEINTIYWVPSALCQVANMHVLEKIDVPTLHTILFAGEVMPTKQLNIWRKYVPNALYADLFGPTEVTDICTYYVLDRPLSNDESVPIGFSCDNMDVMVITEDGNLAEKNQIGELYVRGSSIAYGYYNNPEKTAESFVQNPIHDAYPEIVYKTGDLVYVNDHDEIIYVSRKDFQIKHMGYRIELGEIETAVSSLEGIDRNCCVYDFEKAMIVLFYTGALDKSALRKKLKLLLPKYMLPNLVNQLEEMPLNLNGKIDRNLLTTQVQERR